MAEEIFPNTVAGGATSPRSATPANPLGLTLLATGAVFSVGLLIAVTGLVAGVYGSQISILLLAAVTASVGLMPVALNGALQRGHVLFSTIALVCATYYVLPALARYIPAGGAAIPGSMATQVVTPADIFHGQTVALIGLLSLFVGYLSPVGSALASTIPRARIEWSRQAGIVVALGMLAMGWAITVLGSVGMLPPDLGTGFIGTLGTARLWAICLLTILYIKRRSRWIVLMLALLIPATMVFGFLTGSKREALVGAALPVLTYMIMYRRISLRWITAGVLALIALYPISEFYRSAIIGEGRTSAVEALMRPDETLGRVARFAVDAELSDLLLSGLESTAARVDGLGVTSVFVRDTPRVVPFQRGWTLALFFIAPIPRAIWPSKPDMTIGQWITDTYSSGLDTRTAATQIGEYYINFGVIGVIGGMILLGFVLRTTHETLIVRGGTIPAILAATIVLYYLVTKFESAVAKQYSNILFALVPLVAMHLLIRILGFHDRLPGAAASVDRPGEVN